MYSQIEAISAQRPEITFGTKTIETIVDETGLLGYNLEDGVNVGMALYAKKRDSAGSYVAGSTHRRYVISEGLLIPTTLEAAFGEDAVINYRAIALYDGSNDPIQIEETVAAVSPSTAVFTEAFTLHSVKMGGVVLNQATRVSIDFGIDVVVDMGATADLDELIWPTSAAIRAIEPTITIEGIDAEWFKSSNVPLAGVNAGHSNSWVRLAKRADKSTFLAANASEHIVFTVHGLTFVETPFSASGKESATCTVSAKCQWDGTNAPIKVTTDSTLA